MKTTLTAAGTDTMTSGKCFCAKANPKAALCMPAGALNSIQLNVYLLGNMLQMSDRAALVMQACSLLLQHLQ